jgi:hypothetical protein
MSLRDLPNTLLMKKIFFKINSLKPTEKAIAIKK